MNRPAAALLGIVAVATSAIACRTTDEPTKADTVYEVTLELTAPSGLPKCTTALSGTTAFVSSPAGLWSCQAGTWLQIPCGSVGAGAVAYASATNNLWACSSGRWVAVALPPGPTGPQGPTGAQGAPGETGPAGGSCTVSDNGDGTKTIRCADGSNVTISPSTATKVASFDDETCDPTAVADAGNGIFVDAVGGDDQSGDGSASLPVRTVGQGMAFARALGRRSLFLADGTYDETLDLPAESVLFLEGSWARKAGSWQKRCDDGARRATVISRSLFARGFMGGIKGLTVLGDTLVSSIAVRVFAGRFTVRDSILRAGPGKDGAPGVDGAPGRDADPNADVSCGLGRQYDTPTGRSDPRLGYWIRNEFMPLEGWWTGSGGDGENGILQEAECNAGLCDFAVFVCRATEVRKPVKGECGAGGDGGGPGVPGMGGGASVALFATGDSVVRVFASVLETGKGGDGGLGGKGGPGGAGARGRAVSRSCLVGCTVACNEIKEIVTVTGGDGADGASGGPGGSGAGGPSIAVVRDFRATVAVDAPSVLAPGPGGTGGPGNADGESATIKQVVTY